MKSIDENIIKLDLFCFIILLDFQISFWLLLLLFVEWNIDETGSSKDKNECSTGDETIILGLQIFLDHRSSRTIDQKILMALPPTFFDLKSSLEVVWRSSES